jgi:hypothetical protein
MKREGLDAESKGIESHPGASLDPNDSRFIEMLAQEKDPVAAIHAYEEGDG